jgi:hypothetical protein
MEPPSLPAERRCSSVPEDATVIKAEGAGESTLRQRLN